MTEGYCSVTNKYYPSLDEHHIFPTGYGGPKNGNTIFLGPDIHQLIHRCVENPILKDKLLSMIPQHKKKLANDLILVIRDAKQAFKEGIFINNTTTKRVTLEIPINQYKKLQVMAENFKVSPRQLLTRYINSI